MSAKTSHRRTASTDRPAARQFWLACWLALALLSFQTLAHVHRHVHVHASSGQISAFESTSSASGMPALDSWGHQQGDLSCQLFDQLGQDHAPVAPSALDLQAAAPALPAVTLWTDGSSPLHWKRGARGPPRLS